MASLASDEDSPSQAINGGALSSTASSSSSQQQQQQQQQQQHKQQRAGGGGDTSPNAPPPFLTKTYDMIDDSVTDSIVSWTSKGSSFVVWNPPEFARDLLPKYFKHNNFSSFVRQLNTYGFRKVDPDRWEFANDGFVRGQTHLLKGIHRRKPSAHGHSQHVQHETTSTGGATFAGKLGLEAEIEKLNRDKNVLMLELVRLRQQQQHTERELHLMGQRLHGTEQKQQHMITFFAKAIQSPAFLAQVLNRCRPISVHQLIGHKRKQLDLTADESDEELVRHQLVRYDPTSAQTREKLMRFFSRPDLDSNFDTPLQLELLVRELLREQEQDEEDSRTNNTDDNNKSSNDINRESDVQRLVTTPSSEVSSLEDKQLSPPSAVTEVSDMALTPPLTLCLESPAAGTPVSRTQDVPAAPQPAPPPGEVRAVHASVDSGAVGVGFNDVFWERFLTDSDGTQAQTARD